MAEDIALSHASLALFLAQSHAKTKFPFSAKPQASFSNQPAAASLSLEVRLPTNFHTLTLTHSHQDTLPVDIRLVRQTPDDTSKYNVQLETVIYGFLQQHHRIHLSHQRRAERHCWIPGYCRRTIED